jgi:hypothetical protein
MSKNHIRHAPASNERKGKESVSYCGKVFSDSEWYFVDADHAILTIQQKSFIEPCTECIKEIKRILK